MNRCHAELWMPCWNPYNSTKMNRTRHHLLLIAITAILLGGCRRAVEPEQPTATLRWPTMSTLAEFSLPA